MARCTWADASWSAEPRVKWVAGFGIHRGMNRYSPSWLSAPPPPPAPPISLSAFSSHCCSALQIDKYKVRRCKIRCVCVFWTKELEFNFRCDQDCMLVVTLGCFVLARNLLIGGNFGRLRNKSWSVRDAEFVELYGTAKRRVWNLKKLYRPLKWK